MTRRNHRCRRKGSLLLALLLLSSLFTLESLQCRKPFKIPIYNDRVDGRSRTSTFYTQRLQPDQSTPLKRPNILQRIINYPNYKVNQIKDFFNQELPMMKYLWPKDDLRLKLYLVLSMFFMFFGKWFNLRVPFILQTAIDSLSKPTVSTPNFLLSGASMAIILYGACRAMSVVCSEIKTCLFTHVSQNVLRKFASQIFQHLHSLDSGFHLNTPSGVISVAYVRAVRGFQTMLFQIVFSVAPTALELAMVSNILLKRFDRIFAGITLLTFSMYVLFTVWVTGYRVSLRQELVEVDNARNGFFIDSILNHEVVKLFTNEKKELTRYEGYLRKLQRLNIESTIAVAWLNLGQAALFGLGLTGSLLYALERVKRGAMSVGDLVAVNAMLLQLAVPFNFIGYTYQELRQSFVDMAYMRTIITKQHPAIADPPEGAPSLDLLAPRRGPSSVEFRGVSFSYEREGAGESEEEEEGREGERERMTGERVGGEKGGREGGVGGEDEKERGPKGLHTLRNLSFSLSPGQHVALVGPSGSGKSTTLKLLSRMLDPTEGVVLLDGVDIRTVSLQSLRERIGVIPQDTLLFDESIDFNLRYGSAQCSDEEVARAVELASLSPTIAKFPQGLETKVGERGARLSGGERQKVSIARALLRDPSLLLCDEVTSSVDAFAEREIITTLRRACAQRTVITIAHRLSSIVHSDLILVLEGGEIVERGRHRELLERGGVYRRLWDAQNGGEEQGQGGEGLERERKGEGKSIGERQGAVSPFSYEESSKDEEESLSYLHYSTHLSPRNLPPSSLSSLSPSASHLSLSEEEGRKVSLSSLPAQWEQSVEERGQEESLLQQEVREREEKMRE